MPLFQLVRRKTRTVLARVSTILYAYNPSSTSYLPSKSTFLYELLPTTALVISPTTSKTLLVSHIIQLCYFVAQLCYGFNDRFSHAKRLPCVAVIYSLAPFSTQPTKTLYPRQLYKGPCILGNLNKGVCPLPFYMNGLRDCK